MFFNEDTPAGNTDDFNGDNMFRPGNENASNFETGNKISRL